VTIGAGNQSSRFRNHPIMRLFSADLSKSVGTPPYLESRSTGIGNG